MKRVRHSIFFTLLIGFLLACTSKNQAPVAEIGANESLVLDSVASAPPVSAVARRQTFVVGSHEVSRGETLISIAFQYNIEYTALAKVNGIEPPYVIYPAQILQLDTSQTPPQKTPVADGEESSITTVIIENNSSTRNAGIYLGSAPLRWAWPAMGEVVGTFSNTGIENKGIDIAGQEGDTVLAAEAGEVVYAGSGLLRYGNLLIIRHNQRFLSAYAHNRELLVTEGDKVSRGQKIATLGSTGIDKQMLHFEIRKNGEPVDPEQFLPSR